MWVKRRTLKEAFAEKRKIIPEGEQNDLSKEYYMDNEHAVEAAFWASFANLGEAQGGYEQDREQLLVREGQTLWDFAAKRCASDAERRAAEIIRIIREDERLCHFGNRSLDAIPGPDTLDMGGLFLENRHRIDSSKLFQISHRMPKGCHLGLDFWSQVPLFRFIMQARAVPNMYIRSSQPLLTEADLAETEIFFSIMPDDTKSSNVYLHTYNPEWREPGSMPWMRWADFREEFHLRFHYLTRGAVRGDENGSLESAEIWVYCKIVLTENEAYGISQTTNGLQARIDQAARTVEGLLNYEGAYRNYISAVIDNLAEENIAYAELRLMLTEKYILCNNGIGKYSHSEQMRIIIASIEMKKEEFRRTSSFNSLRFGLKIIYCAPRSIPKGLMQQEVQNCIKLKLEFPDLICGFDLVGAEDRPNSIRFYRDELLAMMATCESLNVQIPFMFHAGETLLDTGGSGDPANSNLYDATVLRAKRVGHCFALTKHPELMEQFKHLQICVELCPTSNELLNLCRNVKGHPYMQILARGIPCTLNSVKPNVFRNSISHEFYQVMVGSPSMSLHGWKQLAEWSIEHSCLNDFEKSEMEREFRLQWELFYKWVIAQYSDYADSIRL